jgi:hypothetical protein
MPFKRRRERSRAWPKNRTFAVAHIRICNAYGAGPSIRFTTLVHCARERRANANPL